MHEPLPRRVAAVVTHDLHRDFETRSAANLAKVGAHKYAADPSMEVLCAAYAVNNGPVKQWWPGDPVPPEWIEAEHDPSWSFVANTDAFETAIERRALAEIFIGNAKAGSHSDAAAKESAVVCSIALQYGAPVETIRHALLRDPDGRPTSPLGAALDLIAGGER